MQYFCVYSVWVYTQQVDCIIDGVLLQLIDGRWYHGAPSSTSAYMRRTIDENMRNNLFVVRNYFSILGRNYRVAFIILWETRSDIVPKSKKVSVYFMRVFFRLHLHEILMKKTAYGTYENCIRQNIIPMHSHIILCTLLSLFSQFARVLNFVVRIIRNS